MFRSWAVVFRIKFVAVQRLSVVLGVLFLLVLGQVPATARPWQSKKAAHSSKSSAAQRKLRHINKAFVASADLRPMAQQLLQNRTPQAYVGVEAYAREHQADEAGPLAETYSSVDYMPVLINEKARRPKPPGSVTLT